MGFDSVPSRQTLLKCCSTNGIALSRLPVCQRGQNTDERRRQIRPLILPLPLQPNDGLASSLTIVDFLDREKKTCVDVNVVLLYGCVGMNRLNNLFIRTARERDEEEVRKLRGHTGANGNQVSLCRFSWSSGCALVSAGLALRSSGVCG